LLIGRMEGEPFDWFDWFDSLRSLTTGRCARSWRADSQVRLGWTPACRAVLHGQGRGAGRLALL